MYKSLQVSAVILSYLASSLSSQAGSFSDILDKASDYAKRGFYRHQQGGEKQPLQERNAQQPLSLDMEAFLGAHTISANYDFVFAPLNQEESSRNGTLCVFKEAND